MTTVFIDTSYLLALELAKDQNHLIASRHWKELQPDVPRLVTTSYVFDETVTFFNSRGYHARAKKIGNSLLHSALVQFIHVDQELFEQGWQYFQKFQDKAYSLTDCISFIVMERLDLSIAFTFDKHFSQAGFIQQPL